MVVKVVRAAGASGADAADAGRREQTDTRSAPPLTPSGHSSLGLPERNKRCGDHLKIAPVPCNWHEPSLFSDLLAAREQRPGTDSYAAVIVIAEVDDGGFDALDRSRFAPGLTERLI